MCARSHTVRKEQVEQVAVNGHQNILQQTVGILLKLRLLVVTYFLVNFSLSIIDTWFQDVWYFALVYGPIGAVYAYFLNCGFLNVAKSKRNLKNFATFVFLYVAIFLLDLGSFKLVLLFFFETFSNTRVPVFIAGMTIITATVVYYISGLLFGTLLPAQAMQIETGIVAALGRAKRQASYLLPRYFCICAPLVLIVLFLRLSVDVTDPAALPISPSFNINVGSLLVWAVSAFLDILNRVIFMVITATAFLKDLEERGVLPKAEAEVFA